MQDEIIEAINELCESLDDKYSINAGGCCYCASLIARGLETLGIKYKLVIFDYETIRVSPLAIRKDILNRNYNSYFHDILFGGSHYAIMLPNRKILNPGSFESYPSVSVCYINHSHIKWMYDNGDWNSFYDTRYNSIVAKRIKQIFKQYEKL